MKANSTFVSLDAEKLHFLPGRTEGRPFRYLTHFLLTPSRSARRDYTLSKREALWLGTEGCMPGRIRLLQFSGGERNEPPAKPFQGAPPYLGKYVISEIMYFATRTNCTRRNERT